VALTFEQFRCGFGNAVSEDEVRQLYEQYHVAGSGIPIFQAAFANFNPRTEARADKKNPDRGPMLIIGGEEDHQVPWAIANATYKEQSENPGVTEVAEIPDRGHSLTIDSGWQEVAQTCLDFIRRSVWSATAGSDDPEFGGARRTAAARSRCPAALCWPPRSLRPRSTGRHAGPARWARTRPERR
jgi:hypothetical protein